MIDSNYRLLDEDKIETPALIVFLDHVQANLDHMLEIAGSPHRLRPHCKTHKTRQIIRLWLERGVTKHKCATIAEAEMLADAGASDVFLAYQVVGPNVDRLVRLTDRFPHVRFAATVDHLHALEALSKRAEQSGREIGVFLDLDPGMHRTGIAPGSSAMELYEAICATPFIRAAGLHWYDGHIRESDLGQRRGQCLASWDRLLGFRNQLLLQGLPVEAVVAAGTGTFPILAEVDEPGLELSPGTTVYHDQGYRELYPEMPFVPALAILTRVISCNCRGFVTLDVGHKSCAADQPAGKRLYFPTLPDAVEFQHTEEHLVVKTDAAHELKLGDALLAFPRHACPASVAFDFAHVVSNGRLVDRWTIVARNRRITV